MPQWKEADKVPKRIEANKLDAEEREDGESYAAKLLEISAAFCSYPTQLMQSLENGFMDYCGDGDNGAAKTTQTTQTTRQPQSAPTYHKAEAASVAAVVGETRTVAATTDNAAVSPTLSMTNRAVPKPVDGGTDEEARSRTSGISSTWSQSEKNMYLLALARKAQQRAVSTGNTVSNDKTISNDQPSPKVHNVAPTTPDPVNNKEVENTTPLPEKVAPPEEDLNKSNEQADDHYRSTERFVPISLSPVIAIEEKEAAQTQSPVLLRPEPRLSNVSEDIDENGSDIQASLCNRDQVSSRSSNTTKPDVKAQKDGKDVLSTSVIDSTSTSGLKGISSQHSVVSSSASVSSTRSGIRKRLGLKKSKQWQELNSDDEGDILPNKNVVMKTQSDDTVRIRNANLHEENNDNYVDIQDSSTSNSSNLLINQKLPKSLSALGLSPSDESGLRHSYAADDCSLATYHTSQTAQSSASQWSVAGRERYLRAMKANESNPRISWIDSMQQAASKSGYSWNPEQGWVDLPTPERKARVVADSESRVVNLDQVDDYSIGSSVSHLSPSILAMIQKKRSNKIKDRKVTFAPEPVKVHVERCSEEDMSLFEENSVSEREIYPQNPKLSEVDETNGSVSDGSSSDSSNRSPSPPSQTIQQYERLRERSASANESIVRQNNEEASQQHGSFSEDDDYSNDEFHEEDVVVSRTNDLISRLEGKTVNSNDNVPSSNDLEPRLSISASEEEESMSIANASRSSSVRESIASRSLATSVSKTSSSKTKGTNTDSKVSNLTGLSWPSQDKAKTETLLAPQISNQYQQDSNKKLEETETKTLSAKRGLQSKQSIVPPSVPDMNAFSFDASTVSTKFTAPVRKKPSLKVDIPTEIEGSNNPRSSPQSNVARKSPTNSERKSPSLLQRLNCTSPCNADNTMFESSSTASESLPMAHLQFMARNSPTVNEANKGTWISSISEKCNPHSMGAIEEENSFDASELDSKFSTSHESSLQDDLKGPRRSSLQVPPSISEDSLSTNVGGSKASEPMGSTRPSGKVKSSFSKSNGNSQIDEEAAKSNYTSSSAPTSWQLLLAKRASQKIADQKSNEAKKRAELAAAAKVEEMMHSLSLSETEEKMEDKRTSQKKRLEEIMSKKRNANRNDEKLKMAEKSAALVVEDMMKQFNVDN